MHLPLWEGALIMSDAIILRHGGKTKYTWNRYNLTETTIYNWNRYTINTTQSLAITNTEQSNLLTISTMYDPHGSMYYFGKGQVSSGTLYYYNQNPLYISDGYITCDFDKSDYYVGYTNISRYSTWSNYVGGVTAYRSNGFWCPVREGSFRQYDSEHAEIWQMIVDALYATNNQYTTMKMWYIPYKTSGTYRRYLYTYEIVNNQTQGSYVGTVDSTSSSAYPSNGVSGNYWYVSSGSSISYSQGALVDTITSEDRNAYPDNSYSGSYWYVYQGESGGQGSLRRILAG